MRNYFVYIEEIFYYTWQSNHPDFPFAFMQMHS